MKDRCLGYALDDLNVNMMIVMLFCVKVYLNWKNSISNGKSPYQMDF